MPYESRKYRRSIRLNDYDYSQPGAYFVTIVCQNRECLLKTELVRRMVERWWAELFNKFLCVTRDQFIVMPNHIHGILIITANDPPFVGAHLGGRPKLEIEGQTHRSEGQTHRSEGQTHRSAPTIGKMVQWFKTMTTNEAIRMVKQNNWTPLPGRFWQRNYYEHIIRNEDELNRIREYIHTNPLRWHLDRENPSCIGKDDFDLWLEQYALPGGEWKQNKK